MYLVYRNRPRPIRVCSSPLLGSCTCICHRSWWQDKLPLRVGVRKGSHRGRSKWAMAYCNCRSCEDWIKASHPCRSKGTYIERVFFVVSVVCLSIIYVHLMARLVSCRITLEMTRIAFFYKMQKQLHLSPLTQVNPLCSNSKLLDHMLTIAPMLA
jgi:hypothetical protein